MKTQKIAINKFIKDNTITDIEKIRIAQCMPKSTPDSFLSKKLIPIGVGRFEGDNMPENWSVNSYFVKGKLYPIYDSENSSFLINPVNGVGMKITPKAWTIMYF